jgi:calcium-dependent protein kinase
MIALVRVQPENILLKSRGIDSEIQLIDFGLATEIKPGETLRRHVGTPYYIAPEVLDKSYTHTADVWSIGVILYTLLCSAPPFFGDTEREIYRRIRTTEVSFDGQEWETRSMQSKSLVYKMLQKVPANRPTLDEVLCEPWIIQEGDMSSDPTEARTFARLFARLRRYGVFPRMKRIVMLHVALKHCSVESRVGRERSFFRAIDRDADDAISSEDLHRFLKDQDAELPFSEAQWIVESMSMREGASSPALFPEFAALVMPRVLYLREASILHEFVYFDRDRNGFIDGPDLSVAMGLPLPEAEAIIAEADLGQGTAGLDFRTFVDLISGSERDAF